MGPFILNPRRRPRVPLRIPVDVSHRGQVWSAETQDLGPGGCLVLSPRPLMERARLRLVLRCQGLTEPLEVGASVAWTCEARGGVAFSAWRFGLPTRPQAWFERVLDARPGLALGLDRVPDRVALDAPLYLLPPPRRILDFTADEVSLLKRARDGITARALLSGTGLSSERARKALLALFEKNVLTLALGQASEGWRWRATLAELGVSSLSESRAARPGTGEKPAAEPRHTESPPAPVPDDGLLRGASAAQRSPEAQAVLQQARAAATAGRIDQAMALLRKALALAPRDSEISKLLCDLAFRNRSV